MVLVACDRAMLLQGGGGDKGKGLHGDARLDLMEMGTMIILYMWESLPSIYYRLMHIHAVSSIYYKVLQNNVLMTLYVLKLTIYI